MFARVLLWIHIWDLFIHVHDSFDSIHFGVLVLVYFVHSQHIHTTACSFSHKYPRLMSSEEVHLFFPTNVSTTSCFFHERAILYMWAMCGKDVLKSYRYWNNRVCFFCLYGHMPCAIMLSFITKTCTLILFLDAPIREQDNFRMEIVLN